MTGRTGPIHLFYADLCAYSCRAAALRELLSAEERAREARFRRREDGEDFVIARGLLRLILGSFAGREPGDIPLAKTPAGKPMIDPASNSRDIRFSVSRSDGRVLYAVGRSREMGVDLERIRQDFPFLAVGDRYFCPREAAAVRGAPREERCAVFFTCWTLKEAFMKGTGKGFSLPMDRFEVSWDPPRLKSVAEDPVAASEWSLGTFEPEPGYAASLAVEGPFPSIRLHALRSGTGPATGFRTSAKRVYCR